MARAIQLGCARMACRYHYCCRVRAVDYFRSLAACSPPNPYAALDAALARRSYAPPLETARGRCPLTRMTMGLPFQLALVHHWKENIRILRWVPISQHLWVVDFPRFHPPRRRRESQKSAGSPFAIADSHTPALCGTLSPVPFTLAHQCSVRPDGVGASSLVSALSSSGCATSKSASAMCFSSWACAGHN